MHAIVTDPPYGLLEYSDQEQAKLGRGRGGVWRIPPSFDGHRRAPLPRFTVLTPATAPRCMIFSSRSEPRRCASRCRALHVLVASNPLLVQSWRHVR